MAVVFNAEMVRDLRPSDDLRVEIIAMRTAYMHQILPTQHFGIGGRVSLFHTPVLTASEEEFAHLCESVQHLGLSPASIRGTILPMGE